MPEPQPAITVTFPRDYLGMCFCGKDATHSEFMQFDTPLAVAEEVAELLPPIEGTWHHVCDDCCDPQSRHKDELSYRKGGR